jgi:hypothetical protein
MTPALKKLLIYKRLYAFNRAVALLLHNFDGIEELRFFPPERVRNWRVTTEHLRALANSAMIETLQPSEEKDAVRFDKILRRWEKLAQDPDDVLLAAKERRRQIREQRHRRKRPGAS